MSLVKALLIAIGVFHLTMRSAGMVGGVDYHVCIKQPGACGEHE